MGSSAGSRVRVAGTARIGRQIAAWAGAAVLQVFAGGSARAIDILPRDYYALPSGTNITAMYYDFIHANQLNVSSGPTFRNDTNLTSNVGIFRQVHFGDIGGRSWAAQVVVPFGAESGQIGGAKLDGTGGLGDVMMSFGMSLLPHPDPAWNVAVSVYVSAPTGDYSPARTLNLGSNRWSFNPQIGYTQAIGAHFWLDGALDVITYTENHDVGGAGATLSQAPTFQAQLWMSWLPDDASLVSVGYAGNVGGTRTVNHLATGVKTQSQQVRLAYSRFLSERFQLVGSAGHDVSVSGGFPRQVEVVLRAALIY
jgi:Putative MetA-pathway of phenol degradation